MFTDGQNIEKSYSLNYQCHEINLLQNITAYFTVLQTESKLCFILCMDTEKSDFEWEFAPCVEFLQLPSPCQIPGQVVWAKPDPPGHDVWSNAPGLPGGMVTLEID